MRHLHRSFEGYGENLKIEMLREALESSNKDSCLYRWAGAQLLYGPEERVKYKELVTIDSALKVPKADTPWYDVSAVARLEGCSGLLESFLTVMVSRMRNNKRELYSPKNLKLDRYLVSEVDRQGSLR